MLFHELNGRWSIVTVLVGRITTCAFTIEKSGVNSVAFACAAVTIESSGPAGPSFMESIWYCGTTNVSGARSAVRSWNTRFQIPWKGCSSRLVLHFELYAQAVGTIQRPREESSQEAWILCRKCRLRDQKLTYTNLNYLLQHVRLHEGSHLIT